MPHQGCFGFAGAVTQVRNGRQSVVTGLLSLAGGRDGTFTVGSDRVAVTGDKVYAQITSAGPSLPPGVPDRVKKQAGALLLSTLNGRVTRRPVAHVDRIEFRKDPDHQGKDSDPYVVIKLPGTATSRSPTPRTSARPARWSRRPRGTTGRCSAWARCTSRPGPRWTGRRGSNVSNWSVLPAYTPKSGPFGGAHGQLVRIDQ